VRASGPRLTQPRGRPLGDAADEVPRVRARAAAGSARGARGARVCIAERLPRARLGRRLAAVVLPPLHADRRARIARDRLAAAEPERIFAAIAAEHERTVAAVLEIVEERQLLDRQPQLQASIRLRNPYVDPMNAIQVELLRRWRSGDERALRPLLRSITGIAAALRNTG